MPSWREPAMPLNYLSARALIDMFDFLYKLGVKHAHENGRDDIFSFLEKTDSPDVYGMMGERLSFGWKVWKSRIYFLSLELSDHKYERIKSILDNAKCIKTVYSSFMPISFMFYTQGLEDGVACPMSHCDLDIFMSISRISVKDYFKAGSLAQKMSENKYIGLVQSHAYALSERETEYRVRSSNRIGAKNYTKFAETFWNVLAAKRGAIKASIRAKRMTARDMAKIREELENGK